MKEEKRFYTYELVDSLTDEVFYVGKGTKARMDMHEWETRKGVQSTKCEKIRSIWASGGHIIKRKDRENLTSEIGRLTSHVKNDHLYH